MVCRVPDDESLHRGKNPAELLLDEAKTRLDPQDFNSWFENADCEFEAPHRIIFYLQNRFRKTWLEKRFKESLRNCARSLFEFEPQIDFEVRAPSASPTARTSGHRGTASNSPNSNGLVNKAGASKLQNGVQSSRILSALDAQAPVETRTSIESTAFNRDFTFDTFVVGPSNRVAHAGAVAICDEPGRSYNPFFVYGDAGLGKTHLLHAICQHLTESRSLRVAYLSSEEFLRRFVHSIASTGRSSPSVWKDIDVLVLDNVQFFSGRERNQDELLLVFNELLDAGKQIVLASNCSARDTGNLQRRLSSRFRSGLSTQICAPSFELRVEILLRKAYRRNLVLKTEVAEYLARSVSGSVRDLEGALIALIHASNIYQKSPDLALAQSALSEATSPVTLRGVVTIDQILSALEEYYQLRRRDLLSHCKARAVAVPRQVGIFLARQFTQLSLADIGMQFGGRDHTTVLYALKRITVLSRSNPQVRGDLQFLKDKILVRWGR